MVTVTSSRGGGKGRIDFWKLMDRVVMGEGVWKGGFGEGEVGVWG